ncbi:hypothetical protein HAX54_037389 [Datura stramonium]|uniref:Uncharacterized protein n=1 Tax=Datura stramonium TaxID=4076 RepID=A0ABS8VJW8_DATST|nr:hypothetical protein [Datura stramonium]
MDLTCESLAICWCWSEVRQSVTSGCQWVLDQFGVGTGGSPVAIILQPNRYLRFTSVSPVPPVELWSSSKFMLFDPFHAFSTQERSDIVFYRYYQEIESKLKPWYDQYMMDEGFGKHRPLPLQTGPSSIEYNRAMMVLLRLEILIAMVPRPLTRYTWLHTEPCLSPFGSLQRKTKKQKRKLSADTSPRDLTLGHREACPRSQDLLIKPSSNYRWEKAWTSVPSPSPSSNRQKPFDKLQTSSNFDPSSTDLSKACLFPPSESSETWNHITLMNEKVGLSSDMGDEWISQTARKDYRDNARWPQLSLFLVNKILLSLILSTVRSFLSLRLVLP